MLTSQILVCFREEGKKKKKEIEMNFLTNPLALCRCPISNGIVGNKFLTSTTSALSVET